MSLQLPFQQKIFQQLLEIRDQLIITSVGLEIESILIEYLASLSLLSLQPTYLIFIISGDESSSTQFEHLCLGKLELTKMDNLKSQKERIEIYKRGGIIRVTSRILIVDMLSDRVPYQFITGIIMLEAHSIKNHSIENFILKLYRQNNQEGFLKAISDSSTYFLSGFNQLENCMKRLYLRDLHLWPRFQLEVKNSLEVGANQVKEYYQPLTKAQKLIMEAITECLNVSLMDLKRTKLLVDIEDELTLDNACTQNLVRLVRYHLEPIWHRVGPQTRQIIEDLVVLRNLLSYLTIYDCVTYLTYLDTVFANGSSYEENNQPSPWMLTDAANTLLTVARARVYRKIDGVARPSLEPLPKWKLIHKIVTDSSHSSSNLKLLIVTKSRIACQQLQAYLTTKSELKSENGKHPMLMALYNRYWSRKGNLDAGLHKNTTTVTINNSKIISHSNNNSGRGRRRVRGGGNVGYQTNLNTFVQRTTSTITPQQPQQQPTDPVDLEDEADLFKEQPDLLTSQLFDFDLELDENVLVDSSYLLQPLDNESAEGGNGKVVVTTKVDLPFLQGYQPDCIIMVEPNLKTIRILEIYNATRALASPSSTTAKGNTVGNEPTNIPTKLETVQVHCLIYTDSQEEQDALTFIRKEKLAFEKLIQTKANMVLPIDVHIPQIEPTESDFNAITNSHFNNNSSSRLAGGQIINLKSKILVDVREFRLTLPSHLHAKNFTLIPATLPIGDYILYDECCIERKTIPDLVGSLKSGRLYFQLEAMTRYYPLSILLIEFDQNKGFGLDVVGDRLTKVKLNDVLGKLLQLVRQFPTLKLVWSPSPKFTADLLITMKMDKKDPNLEFHLQIMDGAQDSLDGKSNPTPTDLLRSLPGVTNSNLHIILQNVKDMQQLVNLNQDQLTELLGKENGSKLYKFINMKLN